MKKQEQYNFPLDTLFFNQEFSCPIDLRQQNTSIDEDSP
jgi:hypothetical protein